MNNEVEAWKAKGKTPQKYKIDDQPRIPMMLPSKSTTENGNNKGELLENALWYVVIYKSHPYIIFPLLLQYMLLLNFLINAFMEE